tara:strand:+ start:13697 stop:14437 length:741 start_codon:yes stop_codon:yes gene_type:complete
MAQIYGDLGLNVAENAKLTIEFFSVLLGESVTFRAMLTDYSDSYETAWESESVYGRMDEIQTYSGTKRSLNIGWTIVSAHTDEARFNMQKCEKLFSMLYPTYDEGGAGAAGLRGAPLFKVKFTNLIQDAAMGASADGASAESAGLLCTVSGFEFSPNLDEGMFVPSDGLLYPKILELSCDLNVLHTHRLGYSSGGGAREGFDPFPYGEGQGDPPPGPEDWASGGNANSDPSAMPWQAADAADMEGT